MTGMGGNLPFGPPSYQRDCNGLPDPNPYFPRIQLVSRPPPPPELGWPVGNIDDYRFETLPQPLSGKTLLEEMQIERPERYLPGEIYRAEPVKRAVEDLSKTANCPKIWIPKDPRFYCEFQPTSDMLHPPLLLDGVLQRKAQTLDSYLVPGRVVLSDDCECVEDSETKAVTRPDYQRLLEHADTRGEDFECEVDDRVCFQDVCKPPVVKDPPKPLYNGWRPSGEE